MHKCIVSLIRCQETASKQATSCGHKVSKNLMQPTDYVPACETWQYMTDNKMLTKFTTWCNCLHKSPMYYTKLQTHRVEHVINENLLLQTQITNKILTQITFMYILDSDSTLKESVLTIMQQSSQFVHAFTASLLGSSLKPITQYNTNITASKIPASTGIMCVCIWTTRIHRKVEINVKMTVNRSSLVLYRRSNSRNMSNLLCCRIKLAAITGHFMQK